MTTSHRTTHIYPAFTDEFFFTTVAIFSTKKEEELSETCESHSHRMGCPVVPRKLSCNLTKEGRITGSLTP